MYELASILLRLGRDVASNVAHAAFDKARCALLCPHHHPESLMRQNQQLRAELELATTLNRIERKAVERAQPRRTHRVRDWS